MKLVQTKAELLPWIQGIEGVYKMVELAGRTCYKSIDKITNDSAKPFVDRMINSHHTAMLEHGTVYLYDKSWIGSPLEKYKINKYSKYSYNYLEKEVCQSDTDYLYEYFVTTNLRVLVENNWLDDLKYLCDPTEFHEKRYTFKLTTDRGVSHELVRHRVMSFAQESTRYCNYSKDKFGGELTFIMPSWYDKYDSFLLNEFDKYLERTESLYMWMMEKGMAPQEARQILPNAIKTEICMTGFASDWRYFLRLRYKEETGKVHPDMKQIATLIYNEFKKNGIEEVYNLDE